ncbi:GNAT family N-acetyltransferase [Paenibacillus lautus]|uniref:GNAT family N-acetyltransferase n=1 Tax=Paenibacillus lautus TaxID=1401 RepID=UPI001C7DA5A2|nr:GNAT family N-acetyltransferase [Paenibacillus lautus]MBX4147154.1 GNAT family N-acetyltransferase [Paenibacillus lautus]
MLILERAMKNDAPKLTEIQKASFNDESKHFNNNEICGPLGYNSVSWQEEMMQNCEYFKVLYNGEIIGGALIFIESNQVHNLGRIFIDPNYQNQGIGKKVMKEIEGSFPDSTKWWLDTPSWSVKNHHFYIKCGFTKVREEGDLYIFEKTF